MGGRGRPVTTTPGGGRTWSRLCAAGRKVWPGSPPLCAAGGADGAERSAREEEEWRKGLVKGSATCLRSLFIPPSQEPGSSSAVAVAIRATFVSVPLVPGAGLRTASQHVGRQEAEDGRLRVAASCPPALPRCVHPAASTPWPSPGSPCPEARGGGRSGAGTQQGGGSEARPLPGSSLGPRLCCMRWSSCPQDLPSLPSGSRLRAATGRRKLPAFPQRLPDPSFLPRRQGGWWAELTRFCQV